MYTNEMQNMLSKVSCKCERCDCFIFESMLRRNMMSDFKIGQNLDKTQKGNLISELRIKKKITGYKFGQFKQITL
tara:strand:+ start:404 stop:628 length:225 start_codon:yes stop_codon:yes gene_type:complete